MEHVRYELDLFYFSPNPAQFAYSHFPDDPTWQFLREPRSMEEFEALPLTKSAFFKFALEFLSHKDAVFVYDLFIYG